ncbi:MAG: hypothetical protein OQL19_20925 [Gammaproteobacteria bacterium]|nr:hypothetical protein [Gammaproteobacteria bacterium]
MSQYDMMQISLDDICDAGKSLGFDLIVVNSNLPLLFGLNPISSLTTLRGTKKNIWDKLNGYKPRFNVKLLTLNDLIDSESIVKQCIENRFSRDSYLGIDKCVAHKMELMRLVLEQNPSLGIKITNDSGKLLGLHLARLNDSIYDYYEIMVDKDIRGGFAALDMIFEGMNRVQNESTLFETVQTRIYSDNVSSLRFFQGLGLESNKSDQYFYHLWCSKLN